MSISTCVSDGEIANFAARRVAIKVTMREYEILKNIYPKCPDLALGWVVLNSVNPTPRGFSVESSIVQEK